MVISNKPDNWDQLPIEKKREQRFNWWLSSDQDINFIDSGARDKYRRKIKRMIDVYNVNEPDQVPVTVSPGVNPFTLNGMDYHTALYDYAKAVESCAKFNARYGAELDSYTVPDIFPARVFDNLSYNLYAWPGHGIPENSTEIQFVEGEYMKANEYTTFLRNPADFWMRTYLPRVFGAFKPLGKMSSLTDIIEFPTAQLMSLADPDVRAMLRKLLEAGDELIKWAGIITDFRRTVQEAGYPVSSIGAFAKAPFDILGDTLRGTQGIMKDMYRQPDKLLEAMDLISDLLIDSVLNSPAASRGQKVFFPLHKGADGWMSQKQFETFYWPPLSKVMKAFINDGLHITLFVEGSYNTRLASLADFPKGSVHWWFDRTDIGKAKEILGNKYSIEGNVPSSLLVTGAPREVKEYCRKLIEVCGKGGGYILGCGAAIENAKLENLQAMVQAASEYGVYRR